MELAFGQWPLGLDNRNDPRRLNPAALSAAQDVLIEDGGRVHSAAHPELSIAAAGLTALWTASGGQSVALTGNTLNRIDGKTLQPVGLLDGSGEAGFAEFAGRRYVGRRGGTLYQMQGDNLIPAALPAPALSAVVTVSGGLTQGRYGVCAALLRDGEEMPTSALNLLNVPEGGGVQVTVNGSGLARLFMTEASGAEPWFVADVPCGLPYFIGAGKRGQPPASRFLEPLPAGRFMAAHGGRLFSAAGLHLYYSEPLRPNLADLRHNHIRLPSPVTLLCAVEDGLYLADRTRSYFIEGTDEGALRLKPLAAPPPPEGCFAVLAGNLFEELPDVPVAVWLAENGVVIGLPSGQCQQPQAPRIRLTTAGLSGSLAVDNRRLYALTT